MNYNCKPRRVRAWWWERLLIVLSGSPKVKSFFKKKYCKDGHGLGKVQNWFYECPDCGATDLDELVVDYDTANGMYFR
jgi:hypothetical protein